MQAPGEFGRLFGRTFLPFGKRFARRNIDFERADYTREILRRELRRESRVNSCEYSVQTPRAALLHDSLQSRANAFVNFGRVEKLCRQCAQVKSGAADQDSALPSRFDVGDGSF